MSLLSGVLNEMYWRRQAAQEAAAAENIVRARQMHFVQWQAWFNKTNAKTARLRCRSIKTKATT